MKTKILSDFQICISVPLKDIFVKKGVKIDTDSRLQFLMYEYRVLINGLRFISKVNISQKAKGVIIIPNLRDTIFYMKTNVLQDFHICISVSLMQRTSVNTF